LAFAWERIALAVASSLAPERAIERAARLFATPPRHKHTEREVELLRYRPRIRGACRPRAHRRVALRRRRPPGRRVLAWLGAGAARSSAGSFRRSSMPATRSSSSITRAMA
jgi:hypothetical protein